ncbi:MAG TPA: TRAP transporter substrate-binding protein [Burkholderiales bacterium]|nr:TRAP transporter substrate-binding protein [Burkholderiales bacterium]
MLNKKIVLAAALLAAALSVQAQEVTLKIHHFLPAGSTAHAKFMQPWCERIARESRNRLKCRIFPSMQLGGTPAQLYDQAKDGVVDIVWTVPGYSAGRFPLVEAFELPFVMRDPEATSRALWEYIEQNDIQEFKDVRALAFHVHGPGVFHMVRKAVRTSADLRGLKVRAPTRQSNKLLAALGATPVGMPVSQVPEALSKGVIDGALVPYEVVPAIKADELTKFHSESDPSEAALYTTVFIFAMNRAKYDGLPPELRKVIDANSGLSLSGEIGRIWREADEAPRKALKGSINVIPHAELEKWKMLAQPVIDAWVKEVTGRGADGAALLDSARRLIAKHRR